MVHHGNQQIQQHDDVDDSVRAEHEHAPEAREDLDAVQLEGVKVHQSECCPEESLHRLEQAGKVTNKTHNNLKTYEPTLAFDVVAGEDPYSNMFM